MLAINLLLNGIFQPIQIFETEALGQCIVNLGVTRFAQFVHSHFEHSRFTGQMCGLVIFRERNINVALFTGLHANQTIFKPWDEAVRTKLKRMTVCSATFKWLAIDLANKVDYHDIA